MHANSFSEAFGRARARSRVCFGERGARATEATGSRPRSPSFPRTAEALSSGLKPPLKYLLLRAVSGIQLRGRAEALRRCHVTADGTKIGKKLDSKLSVQAVGWNQLVPRKARVDGNIHAVLRVKFLFQITAILRYKGFINYI